MNSAETLPSATRTPEQIRAEMLKDAWEQMEIIKKDCREGRGVFTKEEGILLLEKFEVVDDFNLMAEAIDVAKKFYKVGIQALAKVQKRQAVRDELGSYPRDSDTFIELYADTNSVEVRPTHIIDPREYSGICSLAEFADNVMSYAFHKDLPFSEKEIGRAIKRWNKIKVMEFVEGLLVQVTNPIYSAPDNEEHKLAEVLWDKFISIIEQKPERRLHAKLIMKHFVWNTKRMMDMSANNTSVLPIMPVLIGLTGNGKSTTVKKFLGPLGREGEGWITTDFPNLVNPDHYLQAAYTPVAFVDEMARMAAADQNEIKKFMTSDTVQTRVFYTQMMDQKRKIIQPIGTSNFELAMIMTDTSSSRRFYEIHTPDDMKTAYKDWYDEIEWDILWKSVNPRKESPLFLYAKEKGIDIADEIFNIQHKEQRKKTFVEEWLYAEQINGTYMASKLYDMWYQWAESNDKFNYNRANHTMFGRNIMKVEGVTRRDIAKGKEYTIDIDYSSW